MTDQRSEPELIAAATGGDLHAYGELVRRHQHAALRVATVALGTALDAEDVVQESFLKAHGSLPRFRQDAPFKPWLFRIVVNTARNRHRRSGRQNKLALRIGARNDVAEIGPEEHAELAADRREVVAAINRLRPDDRLILTYRWYEQLAEGEIAEALGIRRGTVKSRLNRAMSRLRAELGVESDGSAAAVDRPEPEPGPVQPEADRGEGSRR